jgi:hypothetical protein
MTKAPLHRHAKITAFKIPPFALSRKALAWISVWLLVLSILPLYAISFYNHPFYDDFGFSLLTRDAWQESGSFAAVLDAAWRNTVGIRQTWQGMYTASFISAMQPGIYGEGHYWIATAVLLTGFLLALAFFLWQTLRRGLGVDLSSFWIAFSGLASLMIHFIPDVTEAFFWFNGGVGYTLMACFALVAAGLWLRMERAHTRGKTALLFGLALVFVVLLGGGSYTLLLLCSLLALLAALWAFAVKRPKKWLHLLLCLALLGCFAFSMTAPGNLVRAKTLAGGMSAPMAVAQSFYFGLALMGHWFSLPMAAIMALLSFLMAPALRQSRCAFSRPVWVTLLAACLFCAQLSPTLFTGNYLGDGRVQNITFFTYVLMIHGLVLYWTGWLLRRAENRSVSPAANAPAIPAATARAISPPARGSLLTLVAVLLIVGSIAFHPDGAEGYGPMNLAGGSALRSLLRGEAQAYDLEMDARDTALNDLTQTHVTLSPITAIPGVFMSDALQSDNLEYVLSLYADYYHKSSVSVTPEGE